VLEAQKDAKQARVATASTADAKVLKAKITEALRTLGIEKSTVVKEVVDETLVGGFVATFDYKEYDQSYKRTLKLLFESITK
jgi:F0F1-type ATP synthase delta subunit